MLKFCDQSYVFLLCPKELVSCRQKKLKLENLFLKQLFTPKIGKCIEINFIFIFYNNWIGWLCFALLMPLIVICH